MEEQNVNNNIDNANTNQFTNNNLELNNQNLTTPINNSNQIATNQVASNQVDVNNQTINNENINVPNINNQVNINNQNLSTPIDNSDSKEKSNKKPFIIIGTILTLIVITIATIILMFNLNKKKAYETVVNLGIDDYFKYVFSNEYEKNTNLLDINNEEQVYMYYYYNKNTKKYRIDFEDPTFEGNLYLTYAKWDEYMDYHKKVFGVDSNHKMGMYDLNIDKIKLVEDDLYLLDSSSPYQCKEAENTKNCYMKLTKDTNIKGNVELTNVDIKGNTIVGTVSYDSKTENFEFTFEKNKKDYIIKTLKIVDSIE